MDPDVLGKGFAATTLTLSKLPPRSGPGGDNVATLIQHRAQSAGPADRAMLYLHGFNDYFFQRHIAEHFAGQGFDFYAVDLRGYGRSLREDQLPNFVTDLDFHFEEINQAIQAIRADGHERVTILAHSTGGLIAAMWAHRHRAHRMIDALILNSPWLDLAENWFLRTVGTTAIDILGQYQPYAVIHQDRSEVYGSGLYRDRHGEWDYNLAWKPLGSFPVRAGWFRAVRRHHAILHRGLDVAVPVLVLRSASSLLGIRTWSPETLTADTVLNVEHMSRWAPYIGQHVTVRAIEGGMHDVFLSAKAVREHAFAVVDDWLARIEVDRNSVTAHTGG